MMKPPSLAVYTTTTVPYGYKQNLLQGFGLPIEKDGSFKKVRYHNENNTIDTTHSIIFNYQNPDNRNNLGKPLRPGLDLRISVFDKHKEDGKIWFFDSDVLVAYSKHHQHDDETYVRIAYSKIYPNVARYFNENSDDKRWNKMAQIKDIRLKDYNGSGDQIYICCNRGSAGYSGLGVNAADWAIETATKLRQFTDRNIVIRQHKSSGYPQYMSDFQKLSKFASDNKNITIHSPKFNFPELISEIKKSYAVVVFTSSAGAPAIIEGKPLYVCNETSHLAPMNCGDLNTIEKPNTPDRQQWLNDLGYAHWSLNEIRNGEYWTRVKDQILKEHNG